MRPVGARAILAACIAIGLGASEAAPSSAQGQAPLEIVYITKAATNTGWKIINRGVSECASAEGVRLTVIEPGSGRSVAEQMEALDAAFRLGPAALVLAPLDSSAILPGLKPFFDARIPVVTVDTPVNSDRITANVSTNNLEAGRAQGAAAAKHLEQASDKVFYLMGDLKQSTGYERMKGFVSALRERWPHNPLRVIPTEWQQEFARERLAEALRDEPDVRMVVNAWDGGTMVTIKLLQELGYKPGQVAVIGLDGAPDALAEIASGWVQANVAQMLANIGCESARLARKAALGEQVPADTDTGTAVVDSSNVDAFVQRHLAPYLSQAR
ncbi:MAG TPA: sugar ABC transporter substrate-binding protein [Gammaproteobacteria bacterium]